VPGSYEVELSVGDWSQTRPFEVEKDPRVDVSRQALQEQFSLLSDIAALMERGHDALRTARSVRAQVTHTADRLTNAGHDETLSARADSIARRLTAFENELLETTPGDVAKLEPGWSSALAWLNDYVASAPHAPNDQAYERFRDLRDELDAHVETLEAITREAVPAFNARVDDTGAPTVVVPESAEE
jgi:hypothetical protein